MRLMNFLTGFLSGLALGAVIVLLTTPQSGSNLQAGVRTRFDSILEEGRKAATARRVELEDRLATLRAGA
jgi:gas vesicle protein